MSTSDLRFRKVSGRHQISTDGKHLIDGVAFGRPFLRRAARPTIRIPPRKRQRLTYDDHDDDEEYEARRQVVVHADFGEDEESTANNSYSDDGRNATEDEGDLSAELYDIQNDAESAHSGPTRIGDADRNGGTARYQGLKATGLGLRSSSFLLDENGNPYPAEYSNPLLDMLEDNERAEKSSSIAPLKGRQVRKRVRSNQEKRPESAGMAQGGGSESNLGANGKSVRFDEIGLATPATVRLGSSDDSESDADFEPNDDKSSDIDESDESDKENAMPGSQKPIVVEV